KAADEVDRGIALGEVAGLQAKSGDSSAAFATMKAIEQKKKTLRQLALRNIAIGQGKSGNLKGARQTLKQTKGAFQLVAGREIALHVRQTGKVELALEIAHEVEYSAYQVEALLAVAKAEYQQGRGQSAQKIVRSCQRLAMDIKDRDARGEACKVVAGELARI